MDWLIPAIVATLSATLILALVYAFLYLHERRMALGLWTLAWIFSSFRYSVELGLNDRRSDASYILGVQLFGLLTGVFLIWGCFAWIQRRLPVVWWVLAGLCGAWIVGGVVARVNPLWITYPTFFFTGAIFLVNGILFIRIRDMVGVGRWIVGAAFILWGLHKFDYPVLREMAWVAPWGYLLSSSLSITVAVGLLLAHFERDQRTLRLSQSKVQGLLDSTQETLVMVDRDGVILACNETAARRLGKSVAEMVEHNVYSFLPEPLASSRRQQIDKVFRLGRSVEFEDQREDHVFWSFISPVYNPDGSVRAVSIFAEDITQRRRAEIERNRLFTYSVDLLCIGDLGGYLRELNPAWTQVLGWSETELKSRPWLEFVHPDDRAVCFEGDKRLAGGQAVLGLENRFQCKDGSWRWLSWNAIPLIDEGQVFAIARDVTDSQRVHQALRQSEQNLREAQHIAHIGSWTYSISDNRLEWSDELYHIFGLNRDQGPVSTEQLFARVHPDDRAEFHRQVQARLPYRTDYRIVLPDGTVKLIHEELRTENDAQGRPAFLRGTAQDITEQQLAEETLHESENQYHFLFENMLNGLAYCRMIYEQDRPVDFVYLSVNSVFETLTGLKDVTGHKVSEVIPGIQKSDPGLLEIYGRVARTGTPEKFETHLESLDMWFAISVYSPSRDYFVAVFDVITERKRAEAALVARQEELQLAQERLEIAQQAAGAGAWDWDIPTGRLVWSAELYALFGIDPAIQTASFEAWKAILYPDDRQEAERRIEQALRDKIPLVNEYRIVRPNGTLRWISAFGRGTYDEAGTPIRMAGICIDITEPKQLKAERDRLFNYSIDPMCVAGFDGYLKQLNPAWSRTLGWSAEELMARPWIEFVHPDDREATIQSGKNLTEGKSVIAFENRYRCKDGAYRWLSWNSFPLTRENLVFSAVRDVTDQKTAEQAVRERQATLDGIYRAAPTGIGMVINRVLTQVNDRICEMTGYCREELIGQSARMLYPSQKDYDFVGSEKYNQIHRQGWGSVETRWRQKDGTILDILLSSAPLDLRDLSRGVVFTAMDITERKRTERELIHSHDLMRYIIEHNQSAIAVHDRDLRYIYVSQRYLEEYKVKEKDVIGKHHYEVFPDLPQKWRDVHQRALAGEVCSAEDDPYVRQDGTTDWTRWECRPWYQADGTIGGIIVYTEVITARKRAEEELRISGEKFSKMFRLSPEMASLTRISDGVLLDVNESFERIMGFSRDEAIGHSSAELGIWTDPEDRPRMLRILREKGVVHQYEVRLRRKDKQIITALFSMNPMEIHGEQVALTMVTDITERKRAEDELHESRRRLATLMSNLPGIAYRCRNDRDWTMEFISDGCMALTGYPASDLCGNAKLSYNDIIVPEDREMVWDAAQKALSEYQSYQITYRIRAADGSVKWVWEQGTGVYDAQGNLEALEGFVSDMTARILAEQQREQLLKDLQAKTEELESIIYVSSHDLRSPLVNIQGFSGELGESCRQVRKLLAGDAGPESDHRQLEELLGREIPAALEYITTSVSKLDALQKGLLKICRIGRESLEIGRVAMNKLIDGVLKSTRFQLDNAAAQVTVEPLPECLADAGQLTQVFTNLIDNAVKYRSPDRTLVIRIYGRVEGIHSVYAVADNGVGIAPEHQEKVFEMFHQLDPISGPGGEGLGLTIVKRLLGRMNGQVRLESAPGVGSVFFVLLPKA